MATIRIDRLSPLASHEAWRRLTRWERHADHVPLTTVILRTPPPTRVGTVFVARTGIGRLAFDDPMEVVRWDPPAEDGVGRCRLEKRGTVVTGWAEIEVRTHEAGSRVVWREDLQVQKLPRLFRRPTAWGGRLLFGRTVSGLLTGPE